MIIALFILALLLVGLAVAFFFYYTFGERFIKTLQETNAAHLELHKTRATEAHEMMLALLNRWLRGPAESVDLNEPLDEPKSDAREDLTPEQMAKMDVKDLRARVEREVRAATHGGASQGPGARRFALMAELKRRELDADRERAPAARAKVPNPAVPGEDGFEGDEEGEELGQEDVSYLERAV